MCRNIRVLHDFAPPTTAEEIRAAALQYVRKVSGAGKPSAAMQPAFDQAVEAIARATTELLTALPARKEPRTRELERERARVRGMRRAAR